MSIFNARRVVGKEGTGNFSVAANWYAFFSDKGGLSELSILSLNKGKDTFLYVTFCERV